jgi:carbon-monoxide dehydrogenase small subunit
MLVKLAINGAAFSADVEPRMSLAQFVRSEARLTGTHVGCDTSQCGACTLHVDGIALKSCTLLVVQADGASVTTIEGLAKDGELHPMQRAFNRHHALQCGFCTPGMIMSALDIVRREPVLDAEVVRHNLEGNICRCTGYYNIVDAILSAAAEMAGSSAKKTEDC